MKFFKLSILFFLLVLTASCQTKTNNMNWKFIDFDKIKEETPLMGYFNAINKYSFKDITVINDSSFLIVGNNASGNRELVPEKESEAILFLSLDKGGTFKKRIFGFGELREAFVVGESVFIVNDLSKGLNKSSELIILNNYLDEEVLTIGFNNEKINNIRFFNERIGVANFYSVTKDNESLFINKYTLDGGENWTVIANKDDISDAQITTPNEIIYINNNALVKYNFLENKKEIVKQKIAEDGYYSEGFLEKDVLTNQFYTFITKKNGKDYLAIKYLNTGELIELPSIKHYVHTYGDFYQTLIKDGVYYNYVWSDDKGKTWHTEKIRDFFVTPYTVAYYKKEVYTFVTLFKGGEKERGGRFAVGSVKSIK